MIETSTSKNNVNYLQKKPEKMTYEIVEELDLMFYDNIKPELDKLSRNPSDETIASILAYSRKK